MDVLMDNLLVHTGRSGDWGAAGGFGVNYPLGQLCSSPVAADQSPSCPSSNQSCESDVVMGANGASTFSVEHQLQQLLGKGAFAPSTGYQPATQQQTQPFSTSRLDLAPGVSPFVNLGPANLVPQQQQHQAAYAGNAQHPAAAALAAPCNSGNTDAALNSISPEDQQALLEMLLKPQHLQHEQHMMPQESGLQDNSFLQPFQQHQEYNYESAPLVLPHELQLLQQAQYPKQEACGYTYQQQQELSTPQRHQVTTAQQILAAADAAAAARRPANRGQPAKQQAGSKRPAAKQLQQPKHAAKAGVPASSEDDAPTPAAPKKRGRPPLNPGKYSRGYLAIKAYRQRKKGMVEGMEADIAAMQEQVQQLEAEHAALQLKQQVLQAAITASDEVLSQMAALQLNTPTPVTSTVGNTNTSSSSGLGASADAAAAALDSALAAEQASGNSRDVDWKSVLGCVEYELRRVSTLTQQQASQRAKVDGVAALNRYTAYVHGTMDHVAQGLLSANAQQQQPRSASPMSPAAVSSSSGYAAFPLGIADLLKLALVQHGLQQQQQQQDPNAAAAAACSGSGVAMNLQSGATDKVGLDFWANVAQQVPAPASHEQQQQLEALLDVYGAALERLAQDRQPLMEQLSAGNASPAGVEGSLELAAAVDAYAARARGMTLSYEWTLQGLLTDEQVAKMSMASCPYLPAVSSVVSCMLKRQM